MTKYERFLSKAINVVDKIAIGTTCVVAFGLVIGWIGFFINRTTMVIGNGIAALAGFIICCLLLLVVVGYLPLVGYNVWKWNR